MEHFGRCPAIFCHVRQECVRAKANAPCHFNEPLAKVYPPSLDYPLGDLGFVDTLSPGLTRWYRFVTYCWLRVWEWQETDWRGVTYVLILLAFNFGLWGVSLDYIFEY